MIRKETCDLVDKVEGSRTRGRGFCQLRDHLF